jgi:hypothetical protein
VAAAVAAEATTAVVAESAAAMAAEATTGVAAESAAFDPTMESTGAVVLKSATAVGETTTMVDIAATGISMVRVSTTGISMVRVSTIRVSDTGISTTIALAKETSAVEASAVEIAGISPFKERAVMGVVPVIPIVAVPGREVVIRIPGELVFIDHAIAAGITVRVDICALVVIGFLVRFLIDRRRRSVDHGRRRYINAGPAEGEPEMRVYIYLCIAFFGDQQTCSCQRGECKDLFHFVLF